MTRRTAPHARRRTSHADFRPSYDAIVVGARAAGAATAMLLARRGLSVLAIDRGEYGTDTRSTNLIAGAGVLQLSRWGLLDTIREAGTPVARRVVYHYGDERVNIDITPRGDVDGLYAPRRSLLDRTLVDAARDAGADVRHGVSMVSVTRSTSGRVNGVELDIDGIRRRVGARWVIGADGIRSRVALQVGAELYRQEASGAGNVYTYYEGLPDDTIVNYHRVGSAAGIIPTNRGGACVWAGTSRGWFERVTRADVPNEYAAQIERFPELAEQLSRARRVDGFRVFPGTAGFLRQAWGDGWALVGDAAYFKDPVSAHGITDALISAELLANAVTDTETRGVDSGEAFDHYERLRDRLASSMMPPVAEVAAFTSQLPDVKRAFQAMNRAMREEWELVESGFGASVAL